MSPKGHSTGMAGEFHVMELLYRLGHEPALTLGNAKSIDILTKSPKGNFYEISVKAIQAGGKWGLGKKEDYSNQKNLVFVLLHYRKFGYLSELPIVRVIPARIAEKIKREWQYTQSALYIYKADLPEMDKYLDAWHYLE